MAFDHKTLEQKWQKKWEEGKCFKAEVDLNNPSSML